MRGSRQGYSTERVTSQTPSQWPSSTVEYCKTTWL
uniref:Uncharacterized protein n=1 Tax=Anguilla anguilla TaxID=7936 RepID=A0A0E9Q388_ANGAN